MQAATKNDPKNLKDERLLIRLEDVWWRSRSESPGLWWVLGRKAIKKNKVREGLASLNEGPAAFCK